MELHVGTSGFSYKSWKGPFYPEKLAASKMLAFYAERLGAVELNNSFYRLPRRSVLEGWAEQVPEDFRFALKASRRITHFARLKDAGEPLGYLIENVRALGPRLGVVFFQLPPNLACDLGRLDAFLELLPEDLPTAFEFRHASWQSDDVAARLREHGASWVDVDGAPADGEAAAAPKPRLTATSDTGYVRLRAPDYDESALAAWARRIHDQPWQRAFVFFKHEDAGAGPRLARAFEAAFAREAERRGARPVRPAAAARRERDAG